MKRIAIILFFMVFFTGVIYCQLFDNTPVSTKDIERGLYDIEYFRKVLLEHGFKYDSQSKDENGISESWCYKRFLENVGENYVNPYPVIHFQISTWIRDGKPWSKAIYVYIYKELYAKYAEEFFNDIRKSYPVKKSTIRI